MTHQNFAFKSGHCLNNSYIILDDHEKMCRTKPAQSCSQISHSLTLSVTSRDAWIISNEFIFHFVHLCLNLDGTSEFVSTSGHSTHYLLLLRFSISYTHIHTRGDTQTHLSPSGDIYSDYAEPREIEERRNQKTGRASITAATNQSSSFLFPAAAKKLPSKRKQTTNNKKKSGRHLICVQRATRSVHNLFWMVGVMPQKWQRRRRCKRWHDNNNKIQ